MSSAPQRLQVRRSANRARPPVDLTPLLQLPIESQGPRPTCIPFAIAAAHEIERHQDSDQLIPAVEPVWWHLTNHGFTGPAGTTLAHAGSALSLVGQCSDQEWPYNDGLGWRSEDPPAVSGPPPWTTAQLTFVPLAHDAVEDDVEDLMAAGHPVILIIEITAEFGRPSPDGLIAIPAITSPISGHHAILAVGAWTHPSHGRVLLVRNSWGPYWGAGGYGLMPLEYLVAFCGQAARVET